MSNWTQKRPKKVNLLRVSLHNDLLLRSDFSAIHCRSRYFTSVHSTAIVSFLDKDNMNSIIKLDCLAFPRMNRRNFGNDVIQLVYNVKQIAVFKAVNLVPLLIDFSQLLRVNSRSFRKPFLSFLAIFFAPSLQQFTTALCTAS